MEQRRGKGEKKNDGWDGEEEENKKGTTQHSDL